MKLRVLEDLGKVAGKRVLFRADFNVPLDDAGNITDDGRIRAAIPTLEKLIAAEARIVICSHLGRPEGKPNPSFSLAPIAVRLEELLGQPVGFAADTIGVEANGMAKALAPGGVGIVENLRFHAEETSKDDATRLEFARKLSTLGELFINDAFGVLHRKQASVVEITQLLPSWAGDLVAREVQVLLRLVDSPARPYTVVLGGAKVSDKLAVIENLLPRIDRLLVGGGMVFTVLAAQGHNIASSLFEADAVDPVKSIFAKAAELDVQIELPNDIVVADRFAPEAAFETVRVTEIANSSFGAAAIGLDIGPETAETYARLVSDSRTVFWNGPMGVFEFPQFAAGTRRLAQALSSFKGFSVIGGGDSASAIRELGFSDQDFSHVSTGGGASLEFLEGRALPGLEPLYDKG